MIASILMFIFGSLVFLFLFWKKLREDYSSEIIFKCGFSILFGVVLGYFLAIKFAPAWFLWAEFLGAIIGLSIGSYQLGIRFYETLEAMTISFLPSVSLMFLEDSVANSSFISFIAFLVVLVFIFVYYFLDLHYKNFSWYRSGKIGFSGLATLGIIFLTRSLLALLRLPVLSFVDKFEPMVSGVMAFICFLLILNLGKNEK